MGLTTVLAAGVGTGDVARWHRPTMPAFTVTGTSCVEPCGGAGGRGMSPPSRRLGCKPQLPPSPRLAGAQRRGLHQRGHRTQPSPETGGAPFLSIASRSRTLKERLRRNSRDPIVLPAEPSLGRSALLRPTAGSTCPAPWPGVSFSDACPGLCHPVAPWSWACSSAVRSRQTLCFLRMRRETNEITRKECLWGQASESRSTNAALPSHFQGRSV